MRVFYTFPEGKAKALTMSYDDGNFQDERLVEIFNRYGIKGTFNLNGGMLGEGNRIPAERIPELYRGHEIATHSLTHPTLTRLSLPYEAHEILEDRKILEKVTGQIVRGHAYPNGVYNEALKQLLKSLGIAYARVTTASNGFELPEDPLEWLPTCHHVDPNLLKKAAFFVDFQKPQYLKLFYVWGHSYEFDNDNSWDKIEEFCRILGGRDDIWYCTNLEIIDYLEAARRLQYTADCSAVYNPSAISVWVQPKEDGVEWGQDVTEVPAGATVRF